MTKAVVCGVAAVAAVVSYRHGYAVVSAYGEDGITAFMIPLTIDGLVYASSMVLLDAARNTRHAPVLAWLLLWLGITATLAANIAHGLHHGPVGAVVAAWPAIALVGCYEMFMGLVRSTSRQHGDQHGPDLVQQALTAYKESIETGERLSERKLAKRFGRSRRWAKKSSKAPKPQSTTEQPVSHLTTLPSLEWNLLLPLVGAMRNP
ncbi:DUF2637 domain-containing protein [Thermobifida halotolerans]|uniref:DUF2637 domain-containing protein n=1 Tax=Thermobifida halotolerans TaxID=483545 RepID=UPI000AA11506|nr:DUF2637 domain-containing protein [Thermobifida halotolerans]